MEYKDLLRGSVLLTAVIATALAAITAVTLGAADDELLAPIAFGWWIVAGGLGVWLGRAERARAALRDPLAAARTSVALPSDPPARMMLTRLWPVIAFAVLAGGAGAFWPQVPAIATGFALLVALSLRKREAAVTAIEDRDGVCFYVEPGSALQPIKLIRTPGLRRDRAPRPKPPPPPPA